MTNDYRRDHRIFRVWRFTATHNQLFMRSEPTAIEGSATRAEIYFGNVQMMFMRPIYKGVHVREMSNAQRRDIMGRFGLDAHIDGRFYFLSSRFADFVVASAPAWREAARSFDEPSLFDDERWPLGDDVDYGTLE